jgi:hypothetical protein
MVGLQDKIRLGGDGCVNLANRLAEWVPPEPGQPRQQTSYERYQMRVGPDPPLDAGAPDLDRDNFPGGSYPRAVDLGYAGACDGREVELGEHLPERTAQRFFEYSNHASGEERLDSVLQPREGGKRIDRKEIDTRAEDLANLKEPAAQGFKGISQERADQGAASRTPACGPADRQTDQETQKVVKTDEDNDNQAGEEGDD